MLKHNVVRMGAGPCDGLQVTNLAREAGVTPATIRYYCRSGLLHARRNPDNDYRYFAPNDVKRVLFIRQAQDLGLKIVDIKSILEIAERGEAPCAKVESLVRERLDAITRQIESLRATRRRIATAIREWEENGDITSMDARFCPLIERLGCH